MFQYLPFENEAYSPYIGKYRTFGLRVLLSQNGLEKEGMLLPDVLQ